MQAAAKVGILVVAFVALLYGAYAILGKALFAPPRARYYADFEDASGIASGSQVLMAGLAVGTVTDTKLMSPTLARLTLDLNPDVKIPANSEAVIPGSLFTLTQGAIMISPPPGPIKGYVSPGTILPGRKASALEGAVPGASDAVAELTKTIKATRGLIEDQSLRKDMKTLMETTNDTLKKFGTLSTQTTGLLSENRVLINKALQDATKAMEDVQQGTAIVVDTMRKGHVEEKTVQMLDRLNATSAKAEHLVASLDDLVSDKGTQGSIKETMANTATISDSGTRIAKSAEVIAKNGEQVSATAVDIANKANALADEAKGTLEDIRGFFGKGHKAAPLNLSAEMDAIRQQDPDYWRTDVTFSTKFKDTSYYIGMWDAFGSNKAIIQLGHDVGNGLTYRYGIYAAKPGVGVDYRFNDRLSLRGDLFDLNDPRLDLKFRVGLGKGVYGWIGEDRILDHAEPTVGIGIQK
jgi:phospholipid/cholesterol/gamma-HCH transport system substrate-binding protein